MHVHSLQLLETTCHLINDISIIIIKQNYVTLLNTECVVNVHDDVDDQ